MQIPVTPRFGAPFDECYMPVTETGCWLWLGEVLWNGYGRYSKNYKRTLAHRESYTRHVGEIPDGMCVLHSCDTPSCVNPAHLRVGTQKENMQEKVAKGRSNAPRGSRQKNAKITYEIAAQIRAESGKQKDIAEKYGVFPSQISRIRSNKAWLMS